MEKKDLKSGMIVELRNRHLHLVCGDKILGKDDWDYLKHYDEDLTNNFDYKHLDIVKVYRCDYNNKKISIIHNQDNEFDGLKLIHQVS